MYYEHPSVTKYKHVKYIAFFFYFAELCLKEKRQFLLYNEEVHTDYNNMDRWTRIGFGSKIDRSFFFFDRSFF